MKRIISCAVAVTMFALAGPVTGQSYMTCLAYRETEDTWGQLVTAAEAAKEKAKADMEAAPSKSSEAYDALEAYLGAFFEAEYAKRKLVVAYGNAYEGPRSDISGVMAELLIQDRERCRERFGL